MSTILDHWAEVENAKIVFNYFGRYPSLHDTEVLEVTLNRELGQDFTGPTLTLTMFVFDSDVAHEDPRRKNSRLVLTFKRVEVANIAGFNHQNPLSDFHVEPYDCPRMKERRWRIWFGEMGTRFDFSCRSMHAKSIEQFQPIDYFKQIKK